MAKFSPGPRRLAIVVQVHAGHAQDFSRRRHSADQVHHYGVPARTRVAERQAGDSPDMILELAGLGAFDRPVARVVDARRHLVCDQLSALDEVFDAEDPDVAERQEKAMVIALGGQLQSQAGVWGAA